MTQLELTKTHFFAISEQKSLKSKKKNLQIQKFPLLSYIHLHL